MQGMLETQNSLRMDSYTTSVKRSAQMASETAEENGEDSEDLGQPNVKRMKPVSSSSASSVLTNAPATAVRGPKLFRPDSVNVALQLSLDCRIGPHFDEAKIRILPHYEPIPYPEMYTRIVQDLIRCALRPEEVIAALKVSAPGEPSTIITFFDRVRETFECKNIPVVQDSSSAQDWLSDLLESLGCCKKLFLPDYLAEEFVCKQCFELNQGHRRSKAAPRAEAAAVKHTQIGDVIEIENDGEERTRNEAEDEERMRIEEEQRKAVEEEKHKRMEEERLKEMLIEEEKKKKEAEKKRKEEEEMVRMEEEKERLKKLKEEKKKAEEEERREKKRVEEEAQQQQKLNAEQNAIRTRKQKEQKESCKKEEELYDKIKNMWPSRDKTTEENATECYNILNSVFMILFKIPEERTELRPDLKNTIISGSPEVSFTHDVRVKIWNGLENEMWKLGDEDPMDSSVLKKITTHSCPGHFSPLNIRGTMLDIWHSLLLHCPKCTDASSSSACLKKLILFMTDEKIDKKVKERSENMRQLYGVEDRRIELVIRKEEVQRMHKIENYNDIMAFFLFHFKLPEGRTELRPDIGNPVVSKIYSLDLLLFEPKVRSRSFRDGQKEMWQLGDEAPMDSSILKAITTHRCSPRCSIIKASGTLLELWHSLLLHCPECIHPRYSQGAWSNVVKFIKAERLRS